MVFGEEKEIPKTGFGRSHISSIERNFRNCI